MNLWVQVGWDPEISGWVWFGKDERASQVGKAANRGGGRELTHRDACKAAKKWLTERMRDVS